ncbi:MmgE/PrpD family protein [candidate division KSB1 bacterium]
MSQTELSDNNPSQGQSNVSIVSEFIDNASFDRLPGEVVVKAKRCLLDFLGVALASKDLSAFTAGAGLLDAFGNSEDATVVGMSQQVPLLSAVWANSLLGSVMDLEDGYYPSIGHPASVVFPVVLPFAEKEGASPTELLTATVIGYEICARAGALMTRFYKERSLGSGGSSVYGAAAAGGCLLKLDRAITETALGIAGCYMPSIPVNKSIQYQTTLKGGIPWGAFVGASAALLARGGFSSPPATIQDPFRSEFDDSARPILATLGRSYEILNVYFKRYPSCRWTHAALDAVITILEEGLIQPGEVETVEVETFAEAARLANYRPATLEGFQFSIPYTVAVALVVGKFTVQQMSEKYLDDSDVQQMADKVRITVDPRLDSMFPKKRPARVTVKTVDGKSITREVVNVHGEPGSDFAEAGVEEKFLSLAGERVGEERAGQILHLVRDLDTVSSLEPLFELLRN